MTSEQREDEMPEKRPYCGAVPRCKGPQKERVFGLVVQGIANLRRQLAQSKKQKADDEDLMRRAMKALAGRYGEMEDAHSALRGRLGRETELGEKP